MMWMINFVICTLPVSEGLYNVVKFLINNNTKINIL